MAQPSHADILAALKAQSSRPAPPTVTHAELASAAPESLTNPGKPALNSRKFYCPREGCRAVIIGPGNAAYIEAKEDLLPTPDGAPFSPTGTAYWHVGGSPFAFDNIGFTLADGKTAVSPNILGLNEAAARGSRIKWLICADCDLGPLGWSYEGGSEAWIAADRLRYSPLAFDAVASDSNTEKV